MRKPAELVLSQGIARRGQIGQQVHEDEGDRPHNRQPLVGANAASGRVDLPICDPQGVAGRAIGIRFPHDESQENEEGQREARLHGAGYPGTSPPGMRLAQTKPCRKDAIAAECIEVASGDLMEGDAAGKGTRRHQHTHQHHEPMTDIRPCNW